ESGALAQWAESDARRREYRGPRSAIPQLEPGVRCGEWKLARTPRDPARRQTLGREAVKGSPAHESLSTGVTARSIRVRGCIRPSADAPARAPPTPPPQVRNLRHQSRMAGVESVSFRSPA